MEQAVEVAGVLVAHLGDDLLDVQVAAAQQAGGGLQPVLLQQLLIGCLLYTSPSIYVTLCGILMSVRLEQ